MGADKKVLIFKERYFMKRVWLVPAILVVLTTLTGCVPLSVKISNADRKVELAELIQINKDLIKKDKQVDDYKQRAHYKMAGVHMVRKALDDALTHYQAVVDIAPSGYLGSRSAGNMSKEKTTKK